MRWNKRLSSPAHFTSFNTVTHTFSLSTPQSLLDVLFSSTPDVSRFSPYDIPFTLTPNISSFLPVFFHCLHSRCPFNFTPCDVPFSSNLDGFTPCSIPLPPPPPPPPPHTHTCARAHTHTHTHTHTDIHTQAIRHVYTSTTVYGYSNNK